MEWHASGEVWANYEYCRWLMNGRAPHLFMPEREAYIRTSSNFLSIIPSDARLHDALENNDPASQPLSEPPLTRPRPDQTVGPALTTSR